jgi:CNT family concentrative nucleoside transporter
MLQLQSAVGLIAFVLLAWALSEARRSVRWRVALIGVPMQVALAALLLKIGQARAAFEPLNAAVVALADATRSGTAFVFGYLGGGPAPFAEVDPQASFLLAFRALPLILVVSALTSLLTYWRVLPWIVYASARLLQRSLGVGGAVGFASAANVFVGMVEAPLFIRPYLAQLTRSELHVVMTTGMATIAGTVLVLYASLLGPRIPEIVTHLLVASIISIPAAITIAIVLVPETGTVTAGLEMPARGADSAMDAVTRGTLSGLELVLNVAAMLVVLVALVALVNRGLGALPDVGGAPIALERILGACMAPLVWLAGVPWSEAPIAGQLMGTKTVLNELLAYVELAQLPAGRLSARSELIMTYALCGFANIGSVGILIGGLATLVPERRPEIIGLGWKSLVAGTLATMSTGAVVGLLHGA